MTEKTCVAWYVCDFYLMVIVCDLTLILAFKNGLRTHAVHLPALEFEFFEANITKPRAQNVKILHSDF